MTSKISLDHLMIHTGQHDLVPPADLLGAPAGTEGYRGAHDGTASLLIALLAIIGIITTVILLGGGQAPQPSSSPVNVPARLSLHGR